MVDRLAPTPGRLERPRCLVPDFDSKPQQLARGVEVEGGLLSHKVCLSRVCYRFRYAPLGVLRGVLGKPLTPLTGRRKIPTRSVELSWWLMYLPAISPAFWPRLVRCISVLGGTLPHCRGSPSRSSGGW